MHVCDAGGSPVLAKLCSQVQFGAAWCNLVQPGAGLFGEAPKSPGTGLFGDAPKSPGAGLLAPKSPRDAGLFGGTPKAPDAGLFGDVVEDPLTKGATQDKELSLLQFDTSQLDPPSLD